MYQLPTVKNPRLILAFAFLVFLFLPLSQCSTTEEQGPDSAEAVTSPADPEKFIPIESLEDGWESAAWTLGNFMFPLLTCLLRPKAYRLKLAASAVQAGAGAWFMYMLYGWIYSWPNEPLLAGHILSLLVLAFLLLSIKRLIDLIRDHLAQGRKAVRTS